MKLSIIILNYKMKGLVKNCLQAVYESNLVDDFEVIVVDNNSKDNIVEYLKPKFPKVKIIESAENNGFGAGNNLGIKQAKGEYVLVLNPDIFVFPDTIQKMLDYIQSDKQIGLLSPKLLNPDKTLQYTCYRWHGWLTPLYRRTFLGKFNFAKKDINRFLLKDIDHNQVQAVDWIQGSCLLLPKKVLQQVNYFDERYFMYFEDTDLCRSINSLGYKIIYFPKAEVIHLHRRQSADKKWFFTFFNKLTWIHLSSWLKYLNKWRKKN